MPQMWRHALPGLGNQWLVLLKDTALVSLISVNDLMLQTKSIATRTQEPFTWLHCGGGDLPGDHPAPVSTFSNALTCARHVLSGGPANV
ncbi:arginine transport system permease [Escherichia coli]|uniref:Arginine transport system permease n=1 Tax=Escherichia coli TaxID=562 RepID=A0A377AW78_ECOLX|nr:arginine transport system permease [Escherichia coli]